MIKYATGFFGAAVIAAALSPAGLAAEKTFAPGAFTGVHAARGVTLEISMGDTHKVSAETNAPDFSDFHVEVKDNILIVRRKSAFTKGHDYRQYNVKVITPSLTLLKASTGAAAEADNIDTDSLTIRINTGASARLSGVCGDINAVARTGGILKAKDLQCRRAAAKARTGGEISLYASEAAQARARMGGIIRIYGDPKQKDSGSFMGGEIRWRKAETSTANVEDKQP